MNLMKLPINFGIITETIRVVKPLLFSPLSRVTASCFHHRLTISTQHEQTSCITQKCKFYDTINTQTVVFNQQLRRLLPKYFNARASERVNILKLLIFN